MRHKFKEEYINTILTHENEEALAEINDEMKRCQILIDYYKWRITELSWIWMSKCHHALTYEQIYKKDLKKAKIEVLKKIQNLLDDE